MIMLALFSSFYVLLGTGSTIIKLGRPRKVNQSVTVFNDSLHVYQTIIHSC
ncbi:hypothetical protein BH18THE2_BH18THE2_23840 [soil metagenome]